MTGAEQESEDTKGWESLSLAFRHDMPVVAHCAQPSNLLAALHAAIRGTWKLVLPAALTLEGVQEAARHVGAAAILTDSEIRSALPVVRAPNTTWPLPVDAVEGSGDQACCHLYTGGSTARPRIWEKTVTNLFSEARFLAHRFGIGAHDRILSLVPSNHVYGLLFGVLLPHVARADIVSERPQLPRVVERVIARTRPTVLVASPMHYRALRGLHVPPGTVRLAFSSGGFLHEKDGAAFLQATAAQVIEVYGSTETGGIASRARAAGETSWRPFEAVAWRVNGEELLVRSPFVSASAVQSDGWVHTRDRVTQDGGGGFVLHGRMDGIVKVGGKRVDLVEMEARLKSCRGVRDAMVVALPRDDGRQSQVAALIEGEVDLESLRREIASVLAPLPVPRPIVPVPRLPYLETGKRDLESARNLLSTKSATERSR